jgi:hypothetical protein
VRIRILATKESTIGDQHLSQHAPAYVPDEKLVVAPIRVIIPKVSQLPVLRRKRIEIGSSP